MSSRPLSRSATALLCAAALLLTLPAAAARAAKKPPAKPAGAPAEGAAADKPYQDWKKVTKDATKKSGFLTLYQKRENLYLELRPDQMNTPVLGIFSMAQGIGRNGVLGGLPIGSAVIEFQRTGDRVLVVQKNTRFVAPAGSAIEKAKDLSISNSVLASLKVESVHDSTKAVLVDFAPLLVSDALDLAEGLRQSFSNKTFRFDKDRSALTSVKVFPENDELEAQLTFSPNDRQGLDINSIPDDRYLSVTVHYSFSKLPEKPMAPRLADDRTGYFLTVAKDFSRDTKEHFFVRYVNRWRLEKKDPNAAVSEPVKPIVFYIDHTIPEKYRASVRKGIEAWQPAFESAGFKNAIVAKDAPADPDWDAEDIRYSTIRWITSSQPSFGAIGPSRVDPRTGEILDADICFEASIVQRRWRLYRNMVGPGGPAGFQLPWLVEQEPGFFGGQHCELAAGASVGASMAWLGALVNEGPAPEGPEWERFVDEMLVHTTLHEVGHTLGLRHNFRSSTATPSDRLHDTAWTRQNGMTASVMDYATPNIARDRGAQGDYYGSVPGTADHWMIRYGYTPSGAADVDGDLAFARKIADESEKAGHEYSTDEDTYGPFALDPRTNIWDLGNDALAFGKDRAAFITSLWRNDKLEERLLAASENEYPVLRRAVDGTLEQYGIALGMAVKYVGGQYQSRSHRGQPDQKDALRPVPAAKQREALDFLAERAFAHDAFKVSPALLNRLAPDRWSHWGAGDQFSIGTGARLDYDLNDKTLSIQNALLDALMNPMLLGRLREAESRSADAFRLAEHLDRMTRMLWGEVGGGAASAAAFKALEGPSTRRDVQRGYVNRLANMVAAPPAILADDARALARLQLSRIDARAARVLAGEAPLGDYTRAHLMETRARIKRALEASRETDTAAAPRPGGGPFGEP
jgi:hypothetical protein